MKAPDWQRLPGLQFDRQSRATQVCLALALAVLWLLGRRYAGIVHDATVYAAQGLRRLDPSLGNDLFFSHGAQDAYTLFPELYALLIGALGTPSAALAVTLAGQAAFAAAAAALAWRLVPAVARWWSLALLAVLSGYYGGVGVFRLAEPFATARTLAEPLVIAALAGTLASRHRTSILALVLAFALHPLVAAPGTAVVFLWHATRRPRLWWLAALAVVPALIALAVLPDLRQTLDPQWLAPLLQRSPHLFVAQWQAPDWSRVLWATLVAGMALRHLAPGARRLAAGTLAVAGAGIAASALLVDGAGSAVAAALQFWRAHWLLHLLAILLLPASVLACWRAGGGGRVAAACLAASACFGRAELPAASLLALLAAGLDAMERSRPHWIGETAQRAGLVLALCAAAAGLLFEVQARMPLRYGGEAALHSGDMLPAFTTVGGLLPLAVVLWLVACSRFTRTAVVAAAMAAAAAASIWDARQPWLRFVDEASGAPNPLRAAIAPGAQVYWPGPYGRSWLVLGRPEWFNVDQGAGIVFHRATALAYDERRRAVSVLEAQTQNCAMWRSAECRIDLSVAQALCIRPGGPAYLLLNAPIEGRSALQWRIPAVLGPPLQLYACSALRQ